MTARPRRSALFLAGDDARAHQDAKSSAADVLVFDLGDAISPEDKDAARQVMMVSLKAGGFGSRERVVRINGRDTPWAAEDVRAAVVAGADAVLIPGAECPGDIMRIARDLREAGAPGSMRLWAMIETPAAILNLDSMLRTAADPSSRLEAAVMGTAKLSKATRARPRPGRAGLLPYLALAVAASRAYCVDIIDGPYDGAGPDGGERDGFQRECDQGRDLGMDGKALTALSQVDVCNAVFAPPQDEIAWARKILAAFAVPANAQKDVLRLEGQTIARIDEDMARRTVELAEAIAALN